MRLSEVLARPVVSQSGDLLGIVRDVVATQDGAPLGADARLLIREVLVGRASFGSHLGCGRPQRQSAPWLVETFVRWRQKETWIIPWTALDLVGDGPIHVRDDSAMTRASTKEKA
jgi:hypothetical protein